MFRYAAAEYLIGPTFHHILASLCEDDLELCNYLGNGVVLLNCLEKLDRFSAFVADKSFVHSDELVASFHHHYLSIGPGGYWQRSKG